VSVTVQVEPVTFVTMEEPAADALPHQHEALAASWLMMQHSLVAAEEVGEEQPAQTGTASNILVQVRKSGLPLLPQIMLDVVVAVEPRPRPPSAGAEPPRA
jgi:hypothetical protein